MRRHPVPALIWIVAALACGPSAPPTERAPPPRSGPTLPPPDLDGLRVLLVSYSRLEFDAEAQQRGCPAGETLGEYVARLVEYGSPIEDGDVHRLTGGCGAFPAEPAPIDPPTDPRAWYCTIDAYTSDPAGESPWHYELRVRVDKASGVLDVKTIACPGTA